jgi:hypothetical protein
VAVVLEEQLSRSLKLMLSWCDADDAIAVVVLMLDLILLP